MSELAHPAESVAESAPDMTLVLKTLVPTLLVAVVLQLGATITLRKINLDTVFIHINKLAGNLTTQVRVTNLSPPQAHQTQKAELVLFSGLLCGRCGHFQLWGEKFAFDHCHWLHALCPPTDGNSSL